MKICRIEKFNKIVLFNLYATDFWLRQKWIRLIIFTGNWWVRFYWILDNLYNIFYIILHLNPEGIKILYFWAHFWLPHQILYRKSAFALQKTPFQKLTKIWIFVKKFCVKPWTLSYILMFACIVYLGTHCILAHASPWKAKVYGLNPISKQSLHFSNLTIYFHFLTEWWRTHSNVLA